MSEVEELRALARCCGNDATEALLEQAADTIEALQQRCEELEQTANNMCVYGEDMRQHAAEWEDVAVGKLAAKEVALRRIGPLRAENDDLRKRIAALEGALIDMMEKVKAAGEAGHFDNWGPCYERARQALSAREETDKMAQLYDDQLQGILEAARNREETGERTVFESLQGEGTPGWCKNCGKHRSLHGDRDAPDGSPEFCPIHGTGRQSEGE